MISRPFWLRKIETAWTRRSIVWLSGVRRVGKTTLARMLSPINLIYKNCDLPSVRREIEDPEFFLDSLPSDGVIVLDEVHRLDDPSLVLKIASDEFPSLKIVATGSSTLAASRKFRDSLTGRKHVVHLTPVLWQECQSIFEIQDLDRRLLHGGLPEALLASNKDSEFFSEWIDSVYARDIQELFRVRNRTGFLSLIGILLRQSGGQLDVTKLARESGLSRPTVNSYLESLQFAYLMRIVRPLHGSSKREIVKQPKCYAFDTGFVTYEKGWDVLRPEDRGLLWEHLVLDTLCTKFPPASILYWKDRSAREIDFVVRTKRDTHHIVECKIDVDRASASTFEEFRKHYPIGKNFVVSPRVRQPYRTRKSGLEITYCDGSNMSDQIP